MNKDVIYIDVEDDITAIIGKVKAAKEKVVALVPPKRIGVLQSAVNLRLLNRAAGQADKRLVLITSNQSLVALASAASVPIARNLQSKPELAEIPALDVDDGEDIIDGEQLPIGELEKTADTPKKSSSVATIKQQPDAPMVRPAPLPTSDNKKAGSGKKVPNFNKFRKKLFLIIGAAVLLIGFLIWAIFFAPHATIVITAKTTSATVDQTVQLSTSGQTSASGNVVRVAQQQQKKQFSVDFTPTGKKEVGDRATGTMRLTRTSVSSDTLTVPAGTSFSAGDYTFVSTNAATLAGTSIGSGGIVQSSATVNVQATAIGEEYNLSPRGYQSNVGGFSAQGSQMSGGSKRQVTVVTSDDIRKATDSLATQKDDTIKGQLTTALGKDVLVINESYTETRSNPVSAPAVDQEATAAKLTVEVTYTMLAIPNSDLKTYLDGAIQAQISGKQDQFVYDNGSGKVTFSQFATGDSGASVKLTANGQVGPKIDEQKVKDQAKGKRYGDVQSQLESIDGVSNVDVKFFPFWVSSVPGDNNKISVEFKLTGNGS